MPALIRSPIVKRGAHFWRDPAGVLMFEYVLDASTKYGPRECEEQDPDMHPEAWDEFLAQEPHAPNPPLVVALEPETKPEEPERPFAKRRDATRE